MSALAETLEAVAEVLDQEGVGWYLFGAQAVAVHGAPRATQDIDITVDLSRGALLDLAETFQSRGFSHRHPELADELIRGGGVLTLRHASGMELDVVAAGSGFEALVLSRAARHPVAEVEIPVAHPTDLAVMKALAGRGKDLDDLRALIAGGAVDVEEARDLLRQFEEALARDDLVARLDAALGAADPRRSRSGN